VLGLSDIYPERTALNHLQVRAKVGRVDPDRVDAVLAVIELTRIAALRVGGSGIAHRFALLLDRGR
jgi:hypothetical protein